MCKSQGRLLALLLVVAMGATRIDSLPTGSFLGDDDGDYDSDENEYDVVFDQRQNGTANVHVSIDGVLLALPAPEISSSASLAGATLLDLFASQLASGGSEDDVSEEIYSGGSEGSSGGASSSSSSTTSTTSTTTAVPPAVGAISSDFAYETLPASLLGQGLSFLFNTRRGEVPFRLNSGGEAAKQTIPVLITKVEKAPGRDESVESNEDSHEVVEPQHVVQELSGRKRRKHKRKYKLRMASMLKPLLKRTVLFQ